MKLISILENMVDIGISIPGFLLPIVKQLKTTVEHMGTVEDSGNLRAERITYIMGQQSAALLCRSISAGRR